MNYDAALDVQILRCADLRQRASFSGWGHTPHRVSFCHLIVVTRGQFTHTVDFVPVTCTEGCWVVVQPGQVHSFDWRTDWDGWLVIFKPEALPETLVKRLSHDVESLFDELPTSFMPQPGEHDAGLRIISQMALDSGRYADLASGNRLIVTGLYYLLMRVNLFVQDHGLSQRKSNQRLFKRFQQFKKMVEVRLSTQHHVHEYAQILGCSEKSLNRAVFAVEKMTAKAYLTQRIVLEAKSMLIHSMQPVGSIGIDLGFDEATNFVKFFKREVGMPPMTFRGLYLEKGS